LLIAGNAFSPLAVLTPVLYRGLAFLVGWTATVGFQYMRFVPIIISTVSAGVVRWVDTPRKIAIAALVTLVDFALRRFRHRRGFVASGAAHSDQALTGRRKIIILPAGKRDFALSPAVAHQSAIIP
jgi:hypothetical protein